MTIDISPTDTDIPVTDIPVIEQEWCGRYAVDDDPATEAGMPQTVVSSTTTADPLTPWLERHPETVILLEAYHCANEVRYYVQFATEDQALDWCNRKKSTHAIEAWCDDWVPAENTRLLELLYPTCPHGLDAGLCAGPGHYPPDLPQR